ncbi:NINE protein [Salibacterium halotolerans]|uniref:TM2 domain-containing protein n=1 Tax=Salibacterium halotolerans TaxID=1884432 RepID=A0A1I5P8U9_9BACI|nr:TM2 domain-containing protein [Salibacterium halotolerans]SFP30539.1 TM2 domain-containing protein [Salibacterium halotolerans]
MSNVALKQDLTSEQQSIVASEFEKRKKSPLILILLWFFLSTFAAHRFYIGPIGRAVAMLLLGWLTLFIWNLIDIFFAWQGMQEENERIEKHIIEEVKLHSK